MSLQVKRTFINLKRFKENSNFTLIKKILHTAGNSLKKGTSFSL